MIKMIVATTRDRARLAEITSVLVRYGLQDIARLLGLESLLGKIRGTRQADADPLPRRLRKALEELGPTFIKLGQILATRTDLLSPAWTQELERLHSQALSLSWSEIEPRVNEALGTPYTEAFESFNTTPLACASMAQIYRARLHGGEEVVVKVMRPGLEKTLRADIRLLRFLAETIEQKSTELARFHPSQMMLNLEVALNQELDFTWEGANGERIRQLFADDANIAIPAIYWPLSSPRLLVQEWLPGTAPHSPEQIAKAGFDGPLLARRGAQAFIKMILEYRLYHADPHPGNVMALAGNRIGFIDFGMIGQLSESRRNQLLVLLLALSRRQSEGIVDAFIAWCDPGERDVTDLELAAQHFLTLQGMAPLKLGKALGDMLATAREFSLSLPPDLVLLFKALITADGVLHTLDPRFDVIATLKPILTRQIQQRYSPRANRRRIPALMGQLLDTAQELPQNLRLILRRIRHGRIYADINIKNINQLGKSLERSALTLAIAIVTAAFTIALAPWVMSTNIHLWGIPLFPFTGIICVVCGITFLIIRFISKR